MNEKEEFVIDEAFKRVAVNLGDKINIDEIKKNAEVISEDLEEVDKDNDEEMRKLVSEKEELGNLIPE